MAILLSAVTTGSGSIACDGAQRDLAFFIEPGGTITGGVVQIEEARSTGYADTWSPIGSAVTLATAVLTVIRVHGAFLAVRARITSTVTGSSTPVVTVEVQGNA